MKELVTIVAVVVSLFGVPLQGNAEEHGPLVLFDQGHGQRFLIAGKGELQLSGLSEILAAQGAVVTASFKEITRDSLSGATAVVISGAFATYKAEEVEALAGFVENGGRLAVMLHIGPPMADLLHRFEVDISNIIVHEQQNIIDKDSNFKVKSLNTIPLFQGIPWFSLYGGWALNPGAKSQSLARTSAEAWVDLDGDKKITVGDAVDTFSVVVSGTYGAGSYIFFGDDAIFQNRYLDQNNRALAANLGKWLIGK